MREIIAVCRSQKQSRPRVATILDRYFWRIGDRTWRGRASNACLDRVSRELRKAAARNTSVVIHEIRKSHESRVPIIRIGSRSRFSEDGIAPVSSHPAKGLKSAEGNDTLKSLGAIVRIAILFHDLGKATSLFQKKLKVCQKGKNPGADAVRHELFSAAVWDNLFGGLQDRELIDQLKKVSHSDIDDACVKAAEQLSKIHAKVARSNSGYQEELGFEFSQRTMSGTISQAVGMLVLTHHRLPDASSNFSSLFANRHVNPAAKLAISDLKISKGVPFWHEEWWSKRLLRDADMLSVETGTPGVDIATRASMMFSDHIGSSLSEVSDGKADHLANLRNGAPADSLSRHVQRVYSEARSAFSTLFKYRDSFPALDEDQTPSSLKHPAPVSDRFLWQAEGANAARRLCEASEGGFFACILAGTGAGKTRGAPTILAGAAFADAIPERRYLRMTLGLGLRVLATQSASEYVSDLGFSSDDVSVLVGTPPVKFEDEVVDMSGSESSSNLPEWLKVERLNGGVPEQGSKREAAWIKSLSLDTDKGLPAFCDKIIEANSRSKSSLKALFSSPILVGTIDHFMGVASPVNSRFLPQSLRVLTSDFILDEVDQYSPEDVAAIGRLVYQIGASGRRLVIMSATLTDTIAGPLYQAYRKGWEDHAKLRNASKRVNILCIGGSPETCVTNADDEGFSTVFSSCRSKVLDDLMKGDPLRRGEFMEAASCWDELVQDVSNGCSRMHDSNAITIDGFKVSVGLVRMTRISHTAAMAVQLPVDCQGKRLRLKVCLHSNFPRIHRAWIERSLSKALTRKGRDPEWGVAKLCESTGAFARAREIGATDIEIVVVTSPVIETGNDLDFDYAIVDPISIRSIIQSAGRVRRHRPFIDRKEANVLIMGRSPVAMQSGVLEYPGVETRPHKDTKVPRVSNLSVFEGREIRMLAGEETFNVVDSRTMHKTDMDVPLRDAELGLYSSMLEGPLSTYENNLICRMNRRITEARKFRRSVTRNLHLSMQGENIDNAEWCIDFAPGTRDSLYIPMDKSKVDIDETLVEGVLFKHLNRSSWVEYKKGDELETSEIIDMMLVSIPDFSSDAFPSLGYNQFTGWTRGKFEDLFSPFGKSL